MNLNYLANLIETKLNANSIGRNFMIFADEGEMKKTAKFEVEKNYTFGLLEIIGDVLTPINSIMIQTISLQLMILADLNSKGFEKIGTEKRKQSVNLIEIKECISEFIKANNGLSNLVEINDITYEMTLALSQPILGQKMALGNISEGLPLNMSIQCVFITNGVNSNNIKIYFNEELLPFTQASINRVKTIETNKYNKSKSTESIIQTGGIDIGVNMPLLRTNECDRLYEDITKYLENQAIAVRVKKFDTSDNYLMIIGNNKIDLEPGKNVGSSFNVVEGKANLLNYETDQWLVQEIEVAENETYVLSMPENYDGIVFWGDGTNTYATKNNLSHIYEKGGKYIIRRFLKDNKPYLLSFNLNGGWGDFEPIRVWKGQKIGKLPKPTKPNVYFNGWQIGGVAITEDTIYNFDENKVAVAQWQTGYILNYTGLNASKEIANESEPIVYYMIGDGTNQSGWEGSFDGTLIIPNDYKDKPIIKIGDRAFSGAVGLSFIEITPGCNIQIIGDYAFANTPLREIYNTSFNPSLSFMQLTTIGEYAFRNCVNLENDAFIQLVSNNYVTTINAGAFEGCSSLTSISLLQTNVGMFAFKNCTSLQNVIFSYDIDYIGYNAFEGCVNLGKVTCYKATPPTISGKVFPDSLERIEVLSGSVDTYKAADGWDYYSGIIFSI